MFHHKLIAPIFLLVAALGSNSQAQAQLSIPAYETTYCVQVKWEMWRNGANYWATEYETQDLAEAQLVYGFFESAFENGTLCDILGCGFDWIPVDVRLKTKVTWNLYAVRKEPVFQQATIRWP